MKCVRRRTPTVRLIMRRKKVRPGTTTEQVKLNRPITDCDSFDVTFLSLRKSLRSNLHLDSLSSGRRASILHVSSYIPAKDRTELRPTVFSGAQGTPIHHRTHRTNLLSTIRKSSRRCKVPEMFNL